MPPKSQLLVTPGLSTFRRVLICYVQHPELCLSHQPMIFMYCIEKHKDDITGSTIKYVIKIGFIEQINKHIVAFGKEKPRMAKYKPIKL